MGERELAEALRDARKRTLELVEDLDDAQWLGPMLASVNPLLWEVGHIGWFHERWVLRAALDQPRLDLGALYDSSVVPHDDRWSLPLPDRAATLAYLDDVLSRVTDAVASDALDPRVRYFATLSLFHEDMHGEAFAMTRQTLGYPPPFRASDAPPVASGSHGDVVVPGGTLRLGAERDQAFLFDNEKWAHDVEVAPFAIASRAVTQAEFAAFVDDGGYARRELWSDAGWAWRSSVDATAPVYWRREGRDGWTRRRFDQHVALEPELPMVHAAWYEAEAYCAWAKRRLPTEAEWERAATFDPAAPAVRRAQPWGAGASTHERANLDGRRAGPVSVHAFASGDGALGVRQMIGNVWEWTATDFAPYPGFSVDPYEDYSRPWFGTHKVLKGGSFATRARMIRPGFRNFYTPGRRDAFAGFRTCVP